MVDWTAGKRLAVEDDERKRKLWLILSLFVNLGFLAFFKYRDFLLDNFTTVVNAYGFGYQAQPMDIILPMESLFTLSKPCPTLLICTSEKLSQQKPS
jgi:alginate O-acetyltransferase complex protein AlgI